jgi:hypothetical protein
LADLVLDLADFALDEGAADTEGLEEFVGLAVGRNALPLLPVLEPLDL